MNDKQLESLLREAGRMSPSIENDATALAHLARRLHQRRQTRARRIRTITGLTACYLAGLATAWVALAAARHEPAGNVVDRRQPATGVNEEPNQSPASGNQRQTDSVQEPASSPDEIIAGISRYQWLRKLGSEYRQRNDLETAIAYYGQALDAATDEELEISYEHDDWLLISLKKDRATPGIRDQEKGTSV